MADQDNGTYPPGELSRRRVIGGGAAGTLAYLMGLSAVQAHSGTEPFLGCITLVAFNFAPRGWALCNGQLLPINQNQALFSLLGTSFGGNGTTNFALPDLRGRTPVGTSNGPGGRGGEDTHTLTVSEIPAHTHSINVATAAVAGRQRLSPANAVLGASPNPSATLYGQSSAPVALAPGNIGATGGGQPHNNIQPTLCLNYIIALQGIFPS